MYIEIDFLKKNKVAIHIGAIDSKPKKRTKDGD
jgi:hypothetical protein